MKLLCARANKLNPKKSQLSVRSRALACVSALAAVTSASLAHAQQNRDATASAMDAFGETVGLEHIGLYNGTEIRGFNPQNSGAYRIDGAYFARAGGIADGAEDGVSVNVGVNAARLSYPSPSGIVDIHLRGFSPGDHSLSVGLNSYAWFSPMLEFNYALATQNGRVGIAGGGQFLPTTTYPDGSQTEEYYVGAVPAWQISDGIRVRTLLSYGHANYDRGLWGNVVSGDQLPPVQSTNVLLPPHEASGKEYAANVGVLVDGVLDHGWRFGASAIYSADGLSYDFTSFQYDATSLAHATLTNVPEQTTRAAAFEVRASRDFSLGAAENRISAALRYRHRDAINSDTTSFDLGVVDARHPIFPALPGFSDNGLRSHDVIDQEVASLDYAGVFWHRVEFRAGLDFTRYGERFSPLIGEATSSSRDFSFPHASLIYSLSDQSAIFASYVRGLEDSGVAPTFAVNSNEVLPPVLAEQTELGFRHAFTPSLSFIVAGFDVQKPTPGLRNDGVYTLVGEERHRGIEMSLTGQLNSLTRVVFGAVAMDERLSGPLVTSGVAGSHPVGTAPTVVATNIVQTLPFARDWSIDAQLRWTAGKFADTANTLRSRAVTSLNIGARHQFHVGDTHASLRIVATNVLNTRAWDVHTSGAISPVDRPTVWATLTLDLGGNE